VTMIVTLPASDWTIEDSWHVSGLRGTGSHHYSIQDAFIPEELVFPMMGPSCLDGPLYAGLMPFVPLFHSAFAVGLAQGAVNDLLALAGTGKQQYAASSKMREQPVFQYELGRALADLRAAQAYLDRIANSHWQEALDGTLAEHPLTFFESLQASAWIHEAATRVIDKCYTLGGGAALYDSSPLQRRMRDIHAATQHVMTAQRHYQSAGAIAVGLPPTSMA